MAGPAPNPPLSSASASASASASSSPSPTFARSPDALPSWHFPGPSSVFHKREKDAPRHRRVESYTTPVAPVLSTERRAQHRRVKSSASFAGALPPLPSTPAAGEKSRSPLSRFASYAPASMAGSGPLTPAKSLASSRPGSKLQDSPFSDYFTDDGRSSHDYGYSAPSPEAQRMLLRLNKLQSQIMRGTDGESEREALSIVGKRLDSIDLELGSLHSQTRMPLEDSGLFLEEENEDPKQDNDQNRSDEESGTPSGLGVQYHEEAGTARDEEPTKEQRQAEDDHLLRQAQQVLTSVSKAQEQLKQRHAELRELNDAHAVQLDEKDQQIEELKSENEAMQMDLSHDHSELLFLKLQFKGLEVELDALYDDAPEGTRPPQRKTLDEDMDRWRSDWHDVDARMKRRRSHYGVVSSVSRRESHAAEESAARATDDEWTLRTVKQGHGRVQSIVVQRTASDGSAFAIDDTSDMKEEERESGVTGSDKLAASLSTTTYAEHSTQTESIPQAWLNALEDEDGSESLPPLDEDCAITTSSEAGETEVDGGGGGDEQEYATPVKAAWQDLWEGLSSLAGMGDERF